MRGFRMSRMAEEIREQVSDILQHKFSDPRLAWLSVVRVELTPDLKYATLYVSALGDDETQSRSIRALHRALPALRAELSHRLAARRLPEIRLRPDHSIAHSLAVHQTLRELGILDDESGAAAGDEVDDEAVDEAEAEGEDEDEGEETKE